MNKKLLVGKSAIITGARKGMGAKMVELFASQGADIWAHARELTPELRDEWLKIEQRYNVSIRPICFELTDYDAMKEIVKEIQKSKIPVDILVNNAGITYNALFQMSRIEEVRKQFEVNFFALYQLTQYIIKLMVRNKNGSIINISSTAGLDGNSGKSAYGASKAALIAMTKSIAEELGNVGIRANCIAPGITNTDMLSTMPDDIVEDVKNNVDLRRAGETEDVANTALFLASDLSSYITGQVLRVDGGM